MLGIAKKMNNSSNVLPEDFDGVFRFTNFTDSDFTTRWDNIEYTFPANKTSPMVMNFTPVEIQNIRKKFARELAEREFYKTEKFKGMNDPKHGAKPALYTDSDLTPFIQRCLEPLPIVSAKAKVLPKQKLEEINAMDMETGEPITQPLNQKKSLIKEGSTVLKD